LAHWCDVVQQIELNLVQFFLLCLFLLVKKLGGITSQHTFIVLYYKLNTKILEELVATIFSAIPEDGGSKFFCNMMYNDVTTGWMTGESGLTGVDVEG